MLVTLGYPTQSIYPKGLHRRGNDLLSELGVFAGVGNEDMGQRLESSLGYANIVQEKRLSSKCSKSPNTTWMWHSYFHVSSKRLPKLHSRHPNGGRTEYTELDRIIRYFGRSNFHSGL